MDYAEEKEYLKGKALAWERLCKALYNVITTDGRNILDAARMNDFMKLLRDELLIDHPGLFAHALGQGIDDALRDFSLYFVKD